MAAGLGFKDFTTGEVLTAADVDGYLMQGIWVFASAAARDAAVTSPQEGNACYLKDTNQVLTYSGSAWVAVGGGSPLTTKGDLYGFSTVDARIPIGANDTVLTADSTQALGLKWAAPAGGGKVLQVVSATYSTQASTTSGTYQDSGLTASITPSSATSKILVLTSNLFYVDRQAAGQVIGKMNIVRGATQIFEQNQIGSGDADSFLVSNVAFSYLDSPSTTSSTTYKQQFARVMTAGTVYVQFNSSNASIILMEIGA